MLTRLFVCVFVCVFVCLFVCLFVCVFVCLFIQTLFMLTRLFVCLFVPTDTIHTDEADEDSLDEEGSVEEEDPGLLMTPTVEENAARQSFLSHSYSTNAGSVDYSGDEQEASNSELADHHAGLIHSNLPALGSA